MDLVNPIETIVHYLLIGGMTCLDRWIGFPIVSVLVCMVTHWIEPMMNHDVRLLIFMIHQATILHGL